MTKKEEKRIIPVKNYILLMILFIGAILIVCYICSWYKTYSSYQKETPIIRNHLPEITSVELEHYIDENPTTIIYMCTSSDETCRNFEKNFIKLIDKKELYNVVTYVNLSDADKYQFLDEFNNRYNYRTSLTLNYPALAAFVDGSIVDLLQDDKPLTITKVEEFISDNTVEEDIYE